MNGPHTPMLATRSWRWPPNALRPGVVCVLLFVSACLACPAAAQAPEGSDATTYALDWWTVDGGGVSYGASDAYILGGTIGQPDAAVPRFGGGYELRAGFWRQSCAATALAGLNITLSGETLTLVWTPGAAHHADEAYQVHRDVTPYFAASDATQRAWVMGNSWPDPSSSVAVGDPLVNYFYLVRSTCGAAYVVSGRVGEFDFTLVPGQ